MRSPRATSSALCAVLVGALALSACTAQEQKSPPAEAGGTATPVRGAVAVAAEREPTSYNDNLSTEHHPRNAVLLNQVLTGFWRYGPEGTVEWNAEFGSVRKLQDEPLSVRYRVGQNVAWSDGTPFDCDDLLLHYVANSGRFTTGEGEQASSMFDAATTTGYEDMRPPTCQPGDKQIDVSYTKPFADWNTMFGPGMLPAHVLAAKVGLTEEQLVTAISNGDQQKLATMASFWNTGWSLDPARLDSRVLPSLGPYRIADWQPGQALTLVHNENYWDDPPEQTGLVLQFVPGHEQSVALHNGEVQVIDPQPQVEMMDQLAAGDDIVIDSYDSYSYEHLDFNFKGVFADERLRKAFAMCVPRQQIIDELIAPVHPDAELLNSRYLRGFSDGYKEVVEPTEANLYTEPYIAEAKRLMAEAGKPELTVRLGYLKPDRRREQVAQLITTACARAGITVQNAGSERFLSTALPAGDFDVAMFSWAGGPQVTSTAGIFNTGGGRNFGGYSNPEVDSLVDKLFATTDQKQQLSIIADIEKVLWMQVPTIPLYTHPSVAAWSKQVIGVIPQPARSGITWNAHQWERE